MIEFTDAAIEAIQDYRAKLQIPDDHLLRIGIRQKNTQEKSLVIGFDLPTAVDQQVQVKGIAVVYHPGQVFYFAGMLIDFVQEAERNGFRLMEKQKKA